MPDPTFNQRDEEYMDGLMQLSGAWVNERPDASKVGLTIMGAALLALADSDGQDMPPEARQEELRDVATEAFAEFEAGRPKDAFQIVHDALINPTTESNGNDQ